MSASLSLALLVPLAFVSSAEEREEAPTVPEPAGADEIDWPAALIREAPELPEPRAELVWLDDVEAALGIAREEERPLFVTLRCLPCKQCASFDRDVLEGGPRLSPLLRQFVTVRLTSARDVDLRLFPIAGYQDLDLSWWGWFLSPDAEVYGVFGGRDRVSDSTRISVDALKRTLERVLAHHYDPRRGERGLDGPPADLSADRRTPVDLPGFASWAKHGAPEAKKGSCLHCHQVADILRQPSLDAKRFDKRRDLADWPLPEQVGLSVERDHGLLVSAVAEDSPAAKAGVKVGDVLGAAGGRLLFSQTDLRGVLHRAPRKAHALELWVVREGQAYRNALELPETWWDHPSDIPPELAWRMSVSQGNVGGQPGFFPLGLSERDRKRWKLPADTMAIRPYYGRNTASPTNRAGLGAHLLIIAVDGERPNIAGRDFLTWFRLRFDPGDEVEYLATNHEGERTTFRIPALKTGY